MGAPAERRQQGAWWGDAITVAAIAVVLLYAAAAGYRTVDDLDLPWQLRDARYLLSTGRIASHDVFSYTAAGQPFTYPQLAGLARARFLLGDVAGAEAALGAAAAWAPRQPTIQLMLAEFYLGQGRRGEARAALEQAASLGASGSLFDQLQEKIGRQ
jgi:Flp pilus assembly protein TadD